MPYARVGPTKPQCHNSALICVLALALGSGIGKFGFHALAAPARAEQAVQQLGASGQTLERGTSD